MRLTGRFSSSRAFALAALTSALTAAACGGLVAGETDPTATRVSGTKTGMPGDAPPANSPPEAAPFYVEPCSDGPRWEGGTRFQLELHGPTTAPACTPHCGPNVEASPRVRVPGMQRLTAAALPSGACVHAGNTCTMGAQSLGPCPPGSDADGPFDLFICRCVSGEWSCTIDGTSPGATAWSCEDGGV